MQYPSQRLIYWHRVVARSALSFRGESTGDLLGVGWVSALARGGPDGVRTAQAAYLAALRR